MFLGPVYIDPLYLVIFVLTLVISAGAQLFISSAYRKWSQVRNSAGLNGAQVGQQIVSRASLGHTDHASAASVESPELIKLTGLRDKGVITEQEYQAKKQQIQQEQSRRSVSASSIHFERTRGQLTDHYDPRSHTVRMSEGVATQPSVASMAIVAHELGHAQQHENHSPLIAMRNFLVPAVRFSPQLAYVLILVGMIFNIAGLFWLGIVFYGLMVLFSILTLPVELDASRRALILLDETGLMQTEADVQGSRRVLTAAATTYIAAAVTAVLQLLYYISIARRRR
jgi:hypothetical protein